MNQLAQDVTDITVQLTQDKATFTQEIQDALVYLQNAASVASALRTPRKINGTDFDGSEDITLPLASTTVSGTVQLNDTLTSINTDHALTAAQGKVLNDIKLDKTENAVSATKLETSRTISLTGGVTGSVSFDGSANASIDTTVTGLGVANGIATLDSNGQVPSTQLPSYVDDVLEYENVAAFPAIGETGKIYVETTGNTTYRWSGTAYVKITSGEVASVAGKTGVVVLSKVDVGLSNVDNTHDADKPISTNTQAALDTKVNTNAVIAIEKGGTGATTVEQAKINLGLAVIRLPAGTDLNNVQTPGTYYCDANVDAAAMLNIPVDMAFSLKVDVTVGVIQEFTSYAQAGTRKFIRGFYVSWGPWQEVVKGANAAESRANLGLGSAATRNIGLGMGDVVTNELARRAFGSMNIANQLPGGWDLNNLSQGDYAFYDADQGYLPNAPPLTYCSLYAFRNFSNAEQLTVLGHEYFTGGIITRGKMGSVWSQWAKHYHTLNTTINGNGYIVPSSPTVKIHPDSFELNEDSIKLGAICEKLGVGHYEISNVDGFHQEGWYFDIPTDRYKNPLIAADYEYLPDERKIVIKAYTVKANTFPFEPDLDTPMDAPQGRWIDIRLYEPEWLSRTELPKPKEPIVDNEGNPAPSRLHELEEGVWIISDENVAILEQERLAAMPALKRRQFRLTLAMNGYDLAEIESLINQIEDPMQRTIAQIEWQDATDFERTNPTLLMMVELLQLTSEQVDQLWSYGLTL